MAGRSVLTRDILKQTEALFSGGAVAGLSDRELLDRFVRFRASNRQAAEASMSALVARHGSMVLGVCRRILGDSAEVDDAFQAAFLVLARKADSVRVDDSIGRWLYGVSRKVAAQARDQNAKNRRRERGQTASDLDRLGSTSDPADVEAERADLRSVIAEELDRLPTKFREAVELCDLTGCTHEQAAERLGWPIGTVRSRLARGRAKLRDRLSRRGLAPASIGPLARIFHRLVGDWICAMA